MWQMDQEFEFKLFKTQVNFYRNVDGVQSKVGDQQLHDDPLVPVETQILQILLRPRFEVVLQKDGLLFGC